MINYTLIAFLILSTVSANAQAQSIHASTCLQDCGQNLPQSLLKKYEMIRNINTHISTEPHNWRLHVQKGLIYRCLGDFNMAILCFSNAIKITPKEDSSYIFRAETYRCSDNHTQSIRDYTKAIRLNQNSKYYTFRARSYWFNNDHTNALNDFRTALQLSPNSDFTYYTRANYWISQNQYNNSISDISKAISLNDKHYGYHFDRGRFHYWFDNYQKAIQDFSIYLSHQPNDAESLYYRGTAFFHLGKIEKSASDLKKAHEIAPDDIPIITALSSTLSSCPNSSVFAPDQAQKLAQFAVDTSRSFFYLQLLARAYAAQGNFKQAIELEKEALSLTIASDEHENTAHAKKILKLYMQNKTYEWCPPQTRP